METKKTITERYDFNTDRLNLSFSFTGDANTRAMDKQGYVHLLREAMESLIREISQAPDEKSKRKK